METSKKALEAPATLVMEFPHGSRLPSFMELHKKFQHFGPLDYIRTYVLPYSSSCHVVFLDKFHTQLAFHHVMNSSNSMFGNMDVKYTLLNVEEYQPTEQEQLNKNDNVGSFKEIGETSSDVSMDFGGSKLILEPMSPTPLPLRKARNEETEFQHKMLSLLERCESIVNNLKDRLGYMPYHPL